MPINCSGRSVAAAKRVMEIDDVLEAINAALGSTELTSRKISVLMFSSSLAASIANCASVIKDRLAAGTSRAKAASRSASLMRSEATCRVKFPVMVAMPASMRSCEISFNST